jgi:DNA polymerase III delta subunit
LNHLDDIDEGLFVLLLNSKLRGNSKWRKTFSESDKFIEFEFNKPEKRDESRFAISHMRSELSSRGLSISSKLLEAICQESNNDVEHIDAQLKKIHLLADIEGTKAISSDLVKPVFIRPYEKKIHGLIRAIESRSVKMLIRSLDVILNHPKDDPTWPICRYLQKMLQSWIGMSLDMENGKDLSKSWSTWEVDKFLKIKSRWSKDSLINLFDQVNLCLRHILEKGTMNKSVMYSNLIHAFLYTKDGELE